MPGMHSRRRMRLGSRLRCGDGPITASICAREMPPGRSSTGGRRQRQHRRFDSHWARAAIEDVVHALAQALPNVLRRCRRELGKAVGAGSRHGTRPLQSRPARPDAPACARRPSRVRQLPGRERQRASSAPGSAGQARTSPLEPARPAAIPRPLRHLHVADVNDDRACGGPALGIEDSRHRMVSRAFAPSRKPSRSGMPPAYLPVTAMRRVQSLLRTRSARHLYRVLACEGSAEFAVSTSTCIPDAGQPGG